MTDRVAICGPGLKRLPSGEHHVHAADCEALVHYGPGRFYGGPEPRFADSPPELPEGSTIKEESCTRTP